jgi:hypothetical protein
MIVSATIVGFRPLSFSFAYAVFRFMSDCGLVPITTRADGEN